MRRDHVYTIEGLVLMLERIIRIPKKSFGDLTWEEVALMIEADSSVSPSGNKYFSSCALDEFLTINYLERKDLQYLQKYISDNIYKDENNSRTKKVNSSFLKALAKDIKEGRFRVKNLE